MQKPRFAALLWAAVLPCGMAYAQPDNVAEFQQQIDTLKADYGQRLQALEVTPTSSSPNTGSNAFNPAVSVILDGRLSAYNNNADNYALPGFALGGEAGLEREGFSLGHSELGIAANVDDKFTGKMTLAIAADNEIELEEAFMETLALGQGFTVRGGRFFPGIGYINQQHEHAWDFADAPLVYAGLWGNKYIDDGVHVSWLAPTTTYVELGAELLDGGHFPAGGDSSSNMDAHVLFINTGGDMNSSNSWQAGLSYFSTEVINREAGSHNHGGSHGGGAATETPSFSGDSDTAGASFIYKWAPDGNYKNSNFKLQAEYFYREETGAVTMLDTVPLENSTYKGEQSGYYLEGVYQFMTQWRTGLRYDYLASDSIGNDLAVLDEAGLFDQFHKPQRYSAMVEWLPSEFSRVRLQYNQDESYRDADQQIILQYTMSLGAHGAHSF